MGFNFTGDNAQFGFYLIGAVYLYSLKLKSGQPVLCLVQSHHQHDIGEYLGIRLEAEHLAVFRRY